MGLAFYLITGMRYHHSRNIEFLSQIDILINKLIGWNIKEQKDYPGIFGIPIAFGLPIEEQGRKTLHAHILIWIKDFSCVREHLFSNNESIRDEAKKEMLNYVDKVMCSSYGGLNISIGNNEIKPADNILKSVSNQKLRNMRHQELCLEEMGKVALCNSNGLEMSTSCIVNNAIEHWCKFSNNNKDVSSNLPMIKERQDIYCMRTIYDISPEYWSELIRNHHIDGSITERYPFQVITKRLQGDQFLNVHNTIASYLFSCNTNIQIGEVDHMYYNTLYGSKSTQKEDTRSFMNVSNALSRRITNQIDKNKENISKVNDNRRQEDGPDFIEGLCCLLSGVTANLSSSVVSAPLGHVLMIKGSRFQFSHEFSPLLLTQIKDVLEGKEHVSYYLRKGYNDKGEQITWPEMFANNYIQRPIELENVSLYEFVQKYKIEYIGNKKKNKNSNNDNRMFFHEDHPGFKFAYVLKRVKEVVPMISIDTDFPDLESLQMDCNNVSSSVWFLRERYSLLVLMLIYPFRMLDDLKNIEQDSYWIKFINLRNKNQLKKERLQLLQNIQDQIQCKKMKSYGDNLSKITIEPVGNENNISRCDEEEEDVHPNDLCRLIEAQGIANELQNIEADSMINSGTFKLLSERSKVSNSMLLKANALNNSVINNDEDHLRVDEDDMNDNQYLNECEKS